MPPAMRLLPAVLLALVPAIANAEPRGVTVAVAEPGYTLEWRDADGAWRSACSSPCEIVLPAGATARVSGPDTADQVMDVGGKDGDRLVVTPAHFPRKPLRRVGIGGVIAGGTVMFIGFFAELGSILGQIHWQSCGESYGYDNDAARVQSSVAACERDRADEAARGRTADAILATGFVLTAVGGAFWLASLIRQSPRVDRVRSAGAPPSLVVRF
jgi:hypothetical protein